MAFIHNEALIRLITQIRNSVENRYVSETMGEVQIPVFFVQVLYWLLNERQEETKKVELYIIASTLLKMGIDMHEQIRVNPRHDDERLQQLAILSGDHYSSLFYLHLAGQHEVEGIRYLSDAICRINEWKMSLHALRNGEGFSDPKKAWCYFEKISSGLVAALADFFHVEDEIRILAAAALVALFDADRLAGLYLKDHEVWLDEILEKKSFLKEACDQLDDPVLKSLLQELPQFEPVVLKESDGV
ncbi:heptaprenyl diphosphate synthase component 1 [Thermoactinomyces mirandus]|uniref:Heptaprenyl diphosphate synthase component 1 n=1 Tax=Thermoactinomyces mirandus TaxID=2756294 RepID=A0A7W1XSS1_9BACL|nr:heptaprenyl diphosphate synthase component 1 [Thermoactinomyces mirandus]MBA4602544.1 heptaprenyl diphosphate synthase component 1 [Thermoactinomyces mirandus]